MISVYNQSADLDELLRKRRLQILYFFLGYAAYLGITLLLHFFVCERFFTSFITLISNVPVFIILISIWTFRESKIKKLIAEFGAGADDREEYEEYEETDY